MQIDSTLEFVSHSGSAATLVGAAGATVVLGNTIDILGAGVGVAAPSIIGTATVFGDDPGTTAAKQAEIQINIGTAATTATSATGNFAVQFAPDDGTNNPGTWETGAETGAKAASELTANQVLRMAMPPAPPNTPTPRFIRLVCEVPAATDFTAGTVSWAAIIKVRDDLRNKYAAANYVAP